MTDYRVPIQLHQVQDEFVRSNAIYRGFVGGRGAGKTWIGAYDLLKRAGCRESAGRMFMAISPTYTVMRDTTLLTFTTTARLLRSVAHFSASHNAFTLGNGAVILFRSGDEPEKLRGPNLSGVWLDEASIMHRDVYDITIGALREGGKQGWLSATFTPKGKTHWTFDVFGSGKNPRAALFHSTSRDNPFMPDGWADELASQYTSVFASQEVDGLFVDMRGTIARREWFRVIDAAPAHGRVVRAWDFASSTKSSADFTVGTLMSEKGGIYTIHHVVREKTGPAGVEELVRQTAAQDGYATHIVLEQEGGSAGAIATGHLIKMLAGYSVEAFHPSADKVTRAMPMLAQAQAGNVNLVNGSWVSPWLDELSEFPEGKHDDQVDSASTAFTALAKGGPFVPKAPASKVMQILGERNKRELIG